MNVLRDYILNLLRFCGDYKFIFLFLLKCSEFISLMVLFNSENKYIVYKVLNLPFTVLPSSMSSNIKDGI